MSTGVDDEVSIDSHALDFGVIMIDGINLLRIRRGAEDIGCGPGRGMEVAEVEKENDG